MEKEIKISVVIPVYNAEKYIGKCLDSIINQTYKNWEVICINDGSSDKSEEIIDTYKNQKYNITLIKQKNMGPGAARNTGIDKANGDYIVFIDADDYIDSNFFSRLNDVVQDTDIVFIDIMQVNGFGERIKDEIMSKYSNSSKETLIRYHMTGKIPWGGVRKAVRRKLLTDNEIYFSNIPVGEEALYSFKILRASKEIKFLTGGTAYYYVIHEGSQSKSKILNPLENVWKLMHHYISAQGILNKYENTLNAFYIIAFLVSIDRAVMYFHLSKAYRYALIQWERKKWILKKEIDFGSLNRKAIFLFPFLKSNCIWGIVLIAYVKNKLLKRGIQNEIRRKNKNFRNIYY